jgi:kynureninase
METLRAKSLRLTGYLQFLLARAPSQLYTVITPAAPNEHGAQLSMLVHEHPRELFQKLEAAGVKTDFREPNVVRTPAVGKMETLHGGRSAKILSGKELGRVILARS